MMKKIVCILLVLSLCSFPAITFADTGADDGYSTVLLTEDFESSLYDSASKVNTPIEGSEVSEAWELSMLEANKPKALHTFNTETENFGEKYGSKALALYDEESATGKKFLIHPTKMTQGYTNVKFEFDINVPEGAVRYVRYYNTSGSNKNEMMVAVDARTNQKRIRLYDAAAAAYGDTVSYEPGTWVNICVIINLAAGNSKLYVNGTYQNSMTLTVSGYNDAKKKMNGFGVDTASKTVTDAPSFIDNIKISVPSPLSVKSIMPVNGASDVAVTDAKLELVCSRKIYDFDEQAVIVTNSSEETVTSTTVIENDKLTITFSEPLSAGETYTAVYNGGEYTFTTAPDTVEASLPVVTDGGSGTFSATATVLNNSETAAEAALVLAVYNSKNTMVAMNADVKSEIAQGASAAFSVSATAPADESSEETYTAKAFVVNNMTDLTMLRSDYSGESFSLSGSGETVFGEDLKVTVNGENMTVNGHTALSGERTVLISVKDPQGTLNHLAPVKTDEDGLLDYTFAPDSENNGVWTVGLSGRKLSAPVNKTVNFISPATQNSILSAVQSAASTDDIAAIFAAANNKTALNIDDKYFTDNAYQIVFEQKATYVEFKDISDMFIEAQTVLDSVNAASWSTLSTVISDNEEILIKNTEGYDYYSSLSETKQNIINKEIKAEYASVDAFREAFSAAVEAYKESLEDNSSSLPSDNDSSGKVSSSISVSTSKKPVSDSGSSGGGGGGAVTATPAVPDTTTEDTQSKTFPDMEEASWAKDAVTFLYEKGIVSGDDKGNFRPLDAVKREEFVKMLVEVFDLTSDEECTFTDADKNAWYASYLAAAMKAGIIFGKEDGSFGVGENITRQDMAVMIFRALEKAAVSLEKAQGEFADSKQISTYAVDAVSALQNIGIISGMGDGRFAPLDSANRAQAATIIFNLFDKGVIE